MGRHYPRQVPTSTLVFGLLTTIAVVAASATLQASGDLNVMRTGWLPPVV